MHILNDFCCICICNKNNLKILSNFDTDEISFYEKLIATVPEMTFKGMSNARLSCEECCNVLKIVYEFRQKCLRSKIMLIDYITRESTIDDLRNQVDNELMKRNDDEMSEENNRLNEVKEFPLHKDYDCMNVDEIKTEMDDYNDEKVIQEADCLIDCSIKSENEDDLDFTHPDLVEVMMQENIDGDGSTTFKNQHDLITILNPFPCDECDKQYPNKQHLEAHQLWHKRRKTSLSYPICSEQFKTSTSYNAHVSVSQPVYHCKDCNKRCVDKQQLEIHMRKHRPDLPIICDICNKEFRQLLSLKAHLRTHRRGKSFQCNVCKKRFTKKSDLGRHNRVHTGYKPHECDICQKKFSRTDHLVKHLKTHSSQVYSCNFCSMKYGQAQVLQEHLYTHEGDLPFKCLVCEGVFATKADKKKHWCTY